MGVLYTQAIADRAQAYADLPLLEKRSPNGLAELAAIWSAIQRQPAGSCRQCQFSDYNATINAYLRDFSRLQHPETMSNTSYQFAPQFADATLTHESYGKVVTADNLTDEDVKFFTSKAGGGRKDVFVKKTGDNAPKETDEGAADVTPARPLVPEDDLKSEQEAHLASVTKLNAAESALASEKEAHEGTKSQLSEVQAQVSDLNEQVAKLNKELADAKAKKTAKHD